MTAGDTATLTVRVTAFGRSAPGAVRKVDVTASSVATPTLSDVVRTRAVRR